ncbi:MAG: DNA polymerase Y family protein [Caulobacterales bacterium]
MVGGAQRLAVVDRLAGQIGVWAGQSLADARAICPSLICAPYEPVADQQALRRLARWCARFSPAVTPVFPNADVAASCYGFFLETAGVAHLFGGEAGVLEALLQRFCVFGLSARGALADTPGLAWGLACFGVGAPRGLVCGEGQGALALADLPVLALRLPCPVVDRLHDLGLKRVCDVLALPRASLARRFGPCVLTQIDAALGDAPEALAVLMPAAQARAHLVLAAPLTTIEGLQEVGRRLCTDLCAQLTALGLGARRVRLTLYRVDGRAIDLVAGAQAPRMAAAHWSRLLRERLARAAERLDLGFGVDAAALTGEDLEGEASRAVGTLAPEAGAIAQALLARQEIAERLSARLGPRAVVGLSGRASHWPERAQRAHAVTAGEAGEGWPEGRERPAFLLRVPEAIEAMAAAPDGVPAQFRWRRVLHRVTRAAGPERIGAEWWREEGLTRDYFRVETAEGRRYWLFRAGLYGRETATPDWFVHGCFP